MNTKSSSMESLRSESLLAVIPRTLTLRLQSSAPLPLFLVGDSSARRQIYSAAHKAVGGRVNVERFLKPVLNFAA